MKKIHQSVDIDKLKSWTEDMIKATEMVETDFTECKK